VRTGRAASQSISTSCHCRACGVVVGASLAGGRTFGELGPVELTLRDRDGAPWARTVLDAGTTKNSLVLAVFYQRGGR